MYDEYVTGMHGDCGQKGSEAAKIEKIDKMI